MELFSIRIQRTFQLVSTEKDLFIYGELPKKMGEITQKWIQHESTSQKANKDLDINGTYFKIFQ